MGEGNDFFIPLSLFFDFIGHISHLLAWREWAVRQVQPIHTNLRSAQNLLL